MKHYMEQVAAILTASGAKATYDGNSNYGHLVIGTLRIWVDSDTYKGRTRAIVCGKRYTDYKHGGMKVRDIAIAILEAIPALNKQAEEHALKAEKAKSLAELRAAHAIDPRIRIRDTWDPQVWPYEIEFKCSSLTEVGIVADMLRDFGGAEEDVKKERRTKPRKFRLVLIGATLSDPDTLIGDELGLKDMPEEVIDDAAELAIGSRISLDEFCYERTQ